MKRHIDERHTIEPRTSAATPLGICALALPVFLAGPALAGCQSAMTPDEHTEAPAGGERVHQPPRPEAELEEDSLEAPDPRPEVAEGDPPGYREVMQVWADPQGDAETWKTSGVALDTSLLELCGIDAKKTYFAYDSAKLREDADETLHEIADCLDDNAGVKLDITGYADPRGSDQYNQELGKSRADTVADHLAEFGVSRDAMQVDSEGESEAPDDPDKWPQARRVDISVAE